MKIALALALAFVALAGPSSAAPGKAGLDLVEFFSGRTRGEGTLKKALSKSAKMTVDTVGRRGSNGELILIDTIKEEGEPPKVRRWVMKPTATGFVGTISDAVGPVKVEVDGTKATIRYKMKGGIGVQQVLTMRDRRTLSSRVTAKKLGVRVATMDAVIRKLD